MKSTDKKILDAAEKQFALHGIEGTSLRKVIAAAGVSQGSLHYHFDGKDGLLQAILERCIPPLMEERVRLLEALPQPPTIRELLSVIALPLARLAIDGGPAGKRIVRLLARLYSENNILYLRTTEKHFQKIGFTFTKRLRTILPALSDGQLELRIEIASSTIFSTLVAIDAPAKGWQTHLAAHPFQPWQIVDELLDFLVQGFN
jgi:AcrR family transcriptional regulator